jgi:predicted porin
MKKSLLALAVLGAFTGVASAQSSVTLFGVVDLSGNDIKNGHTHTQSLQSNQLNSNRLGFRGIEDLGGGLKAGFWLEAGMANEQGIMGGSNGLTTSTGANGASIFNRRSTVSLFSPMGEIRLGRDYDPSFWNTVFDDVDGANGLGQGLNLISSLGSGAITIARDNNTIGYFLPPNIGGVYGQAMVAAGQSSAIGGTPGEKYYGARLGWAAGPADVNVAYGKTKTAFNSDFKMMNAGGSYDFGVVKLYGYYNRNTFQSLRQVVYDVSLSVPLGQGEFRAVYAHENASGTSAAGHNSNPDDANLYSVEYVYNLSKRTALYTTAARISNKGAAAFNVLPGTAADATLAGGKSTGYNLGIRHSF